MFWRSRSGSVAPPRLYRRPTSPKPTIEPESLGTEWGDMHTQLKGRNALFQAAYSQLAEYVEDDTVRFRLAATDAFVEKAQFRLTARARKLTNAGVATAAVALILLISAAIVIIKAGPPMVATGLDLTVFILRSVTIGGIVGGAAYLLVALSRALFHEATVLVTRRHSLRFGRLSVYLHNGQLDAEALMKAFRWSDEVASAFLDLRPDAVKGTTANAVAQVPPILDSVAKVVQAGKTESKP